jgi:hypothetical protein
MEGRIKRERERERKKDEERKISLIAQFYLFLTYFFSLDGATDDDVISKDAKPPYGQSLPSRSFLIFPSDLLNKTFYRCNKLVRLSLLKYSSDNYLQVPYFS